MNCKKINREFLDHLFSKETSEQIMMSHEVKYAETAIYNLIDRVIHIDYIDGSEMNIQTSIAENLEINGIYIEGTEYSFFWPVQFDIDKLIEFVGKR